MQLDSQWYSLLAYQIVNQLWFRLLATQDQFPTSSRLHAWGEGDGMCGLGCGKRGSLLHILCNCKVTMREENEWEQGGITWWHDSVLCAIFRTMYRAVLRFRKEHQQGKLGVSEQEVNKTIHFKSESNIKHSAVRVPVRKAILAEAAVWELQFDMTAPEYNQTKERRFSVEILGGDPALRADGVIWSRSTKTVV